MYSSSCLPKIPVEAILIVLACSIGIAGEVVTGFENGKWAHWGNAQHISMFMFFGFTGILNTLYFYKVNIPPNLDYASAFIAFGMEGLLFANHLHGRSHMDVMLHTYLLYAIYGCAACTALEAYFRESAALALGRTYFTFLQGTWFYQVGFILYPPPGMLSWDQEDHEQMMIVTVIYSWHYAIAAIVMFMGMIIVNQLVKRGVLSSIPAENVVRNDIQYQKIGMTNLGSSEETRPIAGSNGSALRQAFNETSEDEV